MNIKPIETIYKGYRFRSRLEARWAVFFDALGIEWEYEPEGFVLTDGTYYLPDFWLPKLKWFVEVKGNLTDQEGISKARMLDDCPPIGVNGCLIFNQPEYAELISDKNNGPHFNRAFIHYEILSPIESSISLNDFNLAITKARQARFEHGEMPCKY